MIVIDDSGNEDVQQEIADYLDAVRFKNRYGVRFLKNKENIGQVRSIDKAYTEVTTPYIFHCEEDWEFYKHGFMERSIDVLEHDKNIMMVWLREVTDTNGQPVEQEVHSVNETAYRLVSQGFQGIWHGFTWNPGLRRTEDYNKVKPFSQYGENHEAAIAECLVGQEYHKLGYRGAILTEGYVKHIGADDSTRG
jgi:hypothetical protein